MDLPLPSPQSLTLSSVTQLLNLYPTVLAHLPPQKRAPKYDLAALDAFRHVELPQKVQERRVRKGGGKEQEQEQEQEGWIEQGELKRLMEWKLARGTYRPTLPGLIAANPAATVRAATSAAFALFASTVPPRLKDLSLSLPQLKTLFAPLISLRGVGPATASLIFSVAFPDRVPFFSDELFAWIDEWEHKEDGNSKDGKSLSPLLGLKMKYDMKEYLRVWNGVAQVQARVFGIGGGGAKGKGEVMISAADIERAVFVIAKLRGDGKSERLWESVVLGAEGGADEEGEGERQGKGKGKRVCEEEEEVKEEKEVKVKGKGDSNKKPKRKRRG